MPKWVVFEREKSCTIPAKLSVKVISSFNEKLLIQRYKTEILYALIHVVIIFLLIVLILSSLQLFEPYDLYIFLQ